MSSLALWNQIVERAKAAEFEIRTVSQNNRQPLWFRIGVEGALITIQKAESNTPSSRLKMPRKINFKDFDSVFGYYDAWSKRAAGIRQEIRDKSQNSSYILALIADAQAKTA